MRLDASKPNQDNQIPTKIIMKNGDVFAYLIRSSFNNMVVTSIFPAALKLVHIASLFAKS